jgi:hypothetical protein
MPFGYLLVGTVPEAPGVRDTLGPMALVLASGVFAITFLHRTGGREREARAMPQTRDG